MASTILDLAYVVDSGAAATETDGTTPLTLNSEDLALGEFRAVRFVGDTKDPSVSNFTASTSGDSVAGIAQFDVLLTRAGEANVTVRREGITKMVAGGTVSVDDNITSDAAGRAVTAVTGWKVLGTALQNAAAAGELIDVALDLVDQRTAS